MYFVMMKKSLLLTIIVVFLLAFAFSSHAALTDGLVSYYKMDETSGNIYDSLGINNGTIIGSIIYNATGKINRAVTGWGSDPKTDEITIADSNSLDLTTDLTISFWANLEACESTSCSLLMKGTAGTYGIYLYPSGKVAFGNLGTDELQSSADVTGTEYKLLTFRHNASTSYIYVNGVLNSSGTKADYSNTATNLTILNGQALEGIGIIGSMDEVGIWNRSLTESEITQLYNNNGGLSYPFNVTPSGVTLLNPVDNTKTSIASHNFSCQAISNDTLKNVTFNLWNSSNNLIISSSISTNAYTCYQESASIFNQSGTDDSCGQNYNGSYVFDVDTSNMYVNYTKPDNMNVTGLVWKIKYNPTSTVYISIPEICYNQTPLQLGVGARASSIDNNVIPICFNGTEFNAFGYNWYIADPSSISDDNVSSRMNDGDWNTGSIGYAPTHKWAMPKVSNQYGLYEEGIIWNVGSNINSTNTFNFSEVLPYADIFKWNCQATSIDAFDVVSSESAGLNFTITYSSSPPSLVLNSNNFFKGDNSSVIDYTSSILVSNFSLSSILLLSNLSYVVYYPNGTSLFTYTKTEIGTTGFDYFNNTIINNITTLPIGQYTTFINITDEVGNSLVRSNSFFIRPTIGGCNSSLTYQFFNLTTIDDISKNRLTTSSSMQFSYWDLNSPSYQYSFAFSNTSDNYLLCKSYYNNIIQYNFNVTSSALPYYPAKQLIQSGVNGGLGLKDYNLSLVNYSYGYTIVFYAIDTYNNNPLANVFVQVYDTSNNLVTTGYTDGVGILSIFLTPSVTYRIVGSLADYGTETQTINPIPGQTNQYYIKMAKTSLAAQTNFSWYNGVTATLLPDLAWLTNTSIYNFNGTGLSSQYTINYCTLVLTDDDNNLLGSSVSNGSCYAQVNYNASKVGYVISTFTMNLSSGNQTGNIVFVRNYNVNTFYEGDYSILHWLSNDIITFTDAGFGAGTRILIVFFIIAAITIFVASKMQMDNPAVIGGVAVGLIGLFSLVGLLTVHFPSTNVVVINATNVTNSVVVHHGLITSGLEQWVIFLFCLVIYAVWEWGRYI